MTKQEKAMEKLKVDSILSHYLRLKHNVDEFEIHDIQNNMVDVSLFATGKGIADPYINIQEINFKDKRVSGTIDIELAKMYVKSNVDDIVFFE